jgi:hypothetical protein|tara:strand:+ start:346 stop:564 length:219 start_codon:yes stop_codon:yes gene_type:complete
MTRLEKLETLTQIDEYIKYYERLIDDRQHSNEFGVGQVMQSIRQKNDHEIDIYTRCIARLNQRFRKLVLTLK